MYVTPVQYLLILLTSLYVSIAGIVEPGYLKYNFLWIIPNADKSNPTGPAGVASSPAP